MELFSLLAKLTLDSSEYDKQLDEAKKDAEGFDDIQPVLELDNHDFNDNIEESKTLGDTFGSEMESVFKGIKSALTVTGIVGAISGIVNGLKEAVNMTAETADGIDKGSKRLNISTQNYQAWDHALKQSGASINDLQKGILMMNNYLNGEKSDAMSEAFEKLKINADEAGLSTEDLVEKTLLALAGFEGTNDERGFLVNALFGRGGTSLNALLDEGEEGVKSLLNEAEGLGLIMSEDEIKNAVAYGDAVANLNAELDAIRTAFVADIIPVLKDATEWLTQLLQTFNPRMRENSLVETFKKIDEQTLSSIQNLEEKEAKAKAIIDKLAEMGDYWTLDNNGKKTFDALASELIELYPQLDQVIETNKNAIYDNKEAIEANIAAWTELEKQRTLDENIAEKRTEVAKKYADALDKEIEAELKDTDAKAKQAHAIEQMNEVLAKNEELRTAVEGRFGTTTVDESNAAEVFRFAEEFGLPMGTEAVEEYNKAQREAEKLRQEAQQMTEEADKAQEDLTKYAEALAEKMGLNTKNTKEAEQAAIQYTAALNGIPDRVVTKFIQEEERAFAHAIGSAYIPYDNYPALLHRGEKVLTATEARQEAKQVDLSGLEDRIIKAIREGMDGAEVNSYIDGDLVTAKVSKNLAGQLADRRYV